MAFWRVIDIEDVLDFELLNNLTLTLLNLAVNSGRNFTADSPSNDHPQKATEKVECLRFLDCFYLDYSTEKSRTLRDSDVTDVNSARAEAIGFGGTES